MRQRVHALVHGEPGAFGISFPDFPGCVSGGTTDHEALARGAEALHFHVMGMIEDGDLLPRPRTFSQLEADPAFVQDAVGASVASVFVELPGYMIVADRCWID